jgi:hypothetical protein
VARPESVSHAVGGESALLLATDDEQAFALDHRADDAVGG